MHTQRHQGFSRSRILGILAGRCPPRAAWLAAAAFSPGTSVGCGEGTVDVVGTDTDTGATTSTGTTASSGTTTTGDDGPADSTSDGADSTGEDTGEPPPPLCQPLSLPLAEQFEAVRENEGRRLHGDPNELLLNDRWINDETWDELCPTFADHFNAQSGFYVYRPFDENSPDPEGWPAELVENEVVPTPLPVVFFAHSIGGRIADVDDDCPHFYAHIFEALAERGFVVVATATAGGDEWEDKLVTLQCALDWAYTTWEYRDHMSCDVSFIGHSAGGGAAREMITYVAENVSDLHVRAGVGIAPVPGGEPTDGDVAVPYLLLHGPTDEDHSTHAGVVYDIYAPEDSPPTSFASADKVLLWAYGLAHHDWGGQPIGDPGYTDCTLEEPEPTTEQARGRAIASFYIPSFLGWHVLGEDEQRRRFVDLTDYDAGVEAFRRGRVAFSRAGKPKNASIRARTVPGESNKCSATSTCIRSRSKWASQCRNCSAYRPRARYEWCR